MDRYEVYENAQDMMICELDKLIQKNEVSPTTLEYMDKIVDIIKDLDEILDGEDMRMSDGNSQRSYGRYNYNRMGNMNSYRNDMRGNYSRSNSRGNANYNNMNGLDGNSQGNGKKEMIDHLYMAMDNSSNEDERKRIQRMISEIEGK